MAKTKIINIQKNDSFEDVLDIVSKTDATEVIMIFPRGSIFSHEAAYFDALKAEADSRGKQISVMTSDPIIARLASVQSIPLLQSAPSKSAPAKVSFGDFIPELAAARKIKTPVAVPAIVEVQESGRIMKDIVGHEDDTHIDVEQAKEIHAPIPIRAEQPTIPEPVPAVMEKSVANDIEKLWEEEEQIQDPEAHEKHLHAGRWKLKIPKRVYLYGGMALIVLVALIVFIRPGSAKVTLVPHAEDVDIKLRVIISTKLEEVASDTNKIPGQTIKVQSEKKGSYPTSNQKEVAQKASGTLTIFNTTAVVQKFVATTRFESEGGFIFRIPQTITIPAKGSVSSPVYADRPGKEYNIPAGKFVVFAFKGQPNADDFYATSAAAMSGGFIGNAKTVSESDFVKAKEALTADAKKEAADLLQQQIGTLKVVASPEPVIMDPQVNAKVGEAADSLEMSVRVAYETTAFKPEDAMILINRYLEKNGNLYAKLSDIPLAYIFVSEDKEKGVLLIDVRGSGKARLILDLPKISSDIRGFSEPELNNYFQGKAAAHIKLLPRWSRRIPKDTAKISISIDDSK